MNETDLSQTNNRPNLSLFLLIVLIMGAVCIWFFSAYYRDKESLQIAATQKAFERQKEAEENTARSQKAEQDVIQNAVALGRKSNWDRFASKLQELRDQVAAARVENDKRVIVEDMLLKSPKGRFLISDDRERAIFVALQEKLSFSSSTIEQWTMTSNTLAATASQMRQMETLESDVPPQDFTKILETLDQAKRLTTELKAANHYFNQLVQKGEVQDSSTSDTSNDKGEPNLQESLTATEAERVKQNAIERQKMLADLRQIEEEKTRELLKEKELKLIERDRELLSLQLSSDIKNKETQIDAAKAEAIKELARQEKAKKEAEEDLALEKDMDQIKSLLAPLITKAKSKFDSSGSLIVCVESVPISLNSIKSRGALEPTQAGYSKLKDMVQGIINKGDRPLGSFSTALYEDAPAAEAQRLLRLHGPALVRAGLLAE